MTAETTTGGARARPDEIDCKSEASLERAIEAAKQRMCAAPTREEKLTHWREMVRLMDQRTVHQRRFVERLEQMLSPPSSPTRIAQASVGCRGNAAGGVL